VGQGHPHGGREGGIKKSGRQHQHLELARHDAHADDVAAVLHDRLVMRVQGVPLSSTVNAPVMWREGPITVCDTTPISTPALSPLVMGVTVARLCAGAPPYRMFQALGMAVGPSAKFG
jgi:hypothetical protein